MQKIRRTTLIDAPVDRCFLLSLLIDVHVDQPSGELAGAVYGVPLSGKLVTWSGKHLGHRFEHTSLIDRYRPYSYFRDVAANRQFALFEHEHHFASLDGGTRLRDDVLFAAPAGALRRFAEARLDRNLQAFLKARSLKIKQVAESGQWRRYLELDLAAESDPSPVPANVKI